MGRDGPRGSYGRKVLTTSDIRRRLSAICGQKEPSYSAVFSWVRDVSSDRQLSVCGIATTLKNGTVKPSEVFKEINKIAANDINPNQFQTPLVY